MLLVTSATLSMIVIMLQREILESPHWLVQTGRVADT